MRILSLRTCREDDIGSLTEAHQRVGRERVAPADGKHGRVPGVEARLDGFVLGAIGRRRQE